MKWLMIYLLDEFFFLAFCLKHKNISKLSLCYDQKTSWSCVPWSTDTSDWVWRRVQMNKC